MIHIHTLITRTLTYTHAYTLTDCRENLLLETRYHPGIFTAGKWSCCDHRSKHSQGCRDSFTATQSTEAAQPGFGLQPASHGRGAGGHRGPLPPTPMDEFAPNPPPHSPNSYYHQNCHSQAPGAPHGYEQNELKVPHNQGQRSSHNQRNEPLPPPVPVSVFAHII